MLSNVDLENSIQGFSSALSARLKKCILTQVLGIVGASIEKQKKRLWQLNKSITEGKSCKQLLKKIGQNAPVKPDLSNFSLELNTLCVDLRRLQNSPFDYFVQLKCLGKGIPSIRLPIKLHRADRKFQSWRMLTSFLISENEIQIRYEKETPPKLEQGSVVGADQGLKTTITFSTGSITPATDPHGHSLEDVTHKLSRRRKGSKGFKRAQDHRKNLINFQIKQLNLTGIKQINLEKVWNIGYKTRKSRYLSHWCNTLIRDRLIQAGEEQGVLVKLQPSVYRSQRCSACGLVRKANRKGKEYKCLCGFHLDADLNASLNHVVELPEISFDFRKLNLNRKGFYWKPEGLFDLTGREFAVPYSSQETDSKL